MEGIKQEQEQIEKWQQLLACFQSDVPAPERLKHTTELLLFNPEYYQAWNVRKRLLLAMPADQVGGLLKQELEFSVEAIKRNIKSYCAWHHRVWLMRTIVSPSGESFDCSNELKLCAKLLEADSRNCTLRRR